MSEHDTSKKCSNKEHMMHIAHAIEVFESQHGHYNTWNREEKLWRDILINRINREDGFA